MYLCISCQTFIPSHRPAFICIALFISTEKNKTFSHIVCIYCLCSLYNIPDTTEDGSSNLSDVVGICNNLPIHCNVIQPAYSLFLNINVHNLRLSNQILTGYCELMIRQYVRPFLLYIRKKVLLESMYSIESCYCFHSVRNFFRWIILNCSILFTGWT